MLFEQARNVAHGVNVTVTESREKPWESNTVRLCTCRIDEPPSTRYRAAHRSISIQEAYAMTIYCLYIFDRYVQRHTRILTSTSRTALNPTLQTHTHTTRHCNCVYYHDWQHRTKRPKRANEGGALLPGVSHALSPPPPLTSTSAPSSTSGTPFSSPRNTLTSTSGILVAFGDASQTQSPGTTPPPPSGAASSAGAGLPFDEEAKLVYGVVLSLRNMVKRLSGRCCLSDHPSLIVLVHPVSCVQGRVICQLSYVNLQAAPL